MSQNGLLSVLKFNQNCYAIPVIHFIQALQGILQLKSEMTIYPIKHFIGVADI
jgi:hypothetical protein